MEGIDKATSRRTDIIIHSIARRTADKEEKRKLQEVHTQGNKQEDRQNIRGE